MEKAEGARIRIMEMTDKEWKRLESLGQKEGEEWNRLMAKTEQELEHPEWFEGPCMCKLCMSYGDPE